MIQLELGRYIFFFFKAKKRDTNHKKKEIIEFGDIQYCNGKLGNWAVEGHILPQCILN